MLVLAMLEKRDRYGFELVDRISKRVDIAERTIYPLLKRLKDEQLVDSYLQESNLGPPRKYYKLTEIGKTNLIESKNEWYAMNNAVNQLLKDEENEEVKE